MLGVVPSYFWVSAELATLNLASASIFASTILSISWASLRHRLHYKPSRPRGDIRINGGISSWMFLPYFQFLPSLRSYQNLLPLCAWVTCFSLLLLLYPYLQCFDKNLKGYSNRSMKVQIQDHFSERVGNTRSHIGDSLSAALKWSKGVDKGRIRIFLAKRRIHSATLEFSVKVTNSTIHLTCN